MSFLLCMHYVCVMMSQFRVLHLACSWVGCVAHMGGQSEQMPYWPWLSIRDITQPLGNTSDEAVCYQNWLNTNFLLKVTFC